LIEGDEGHLQNPIVRHVRVEHGATTLAEPLGLSLVDRDRPGQHASALCPVGHGTRQVELIRTGDVLGVAADDVLQYHPHSCHCRYLLSSRTAFSKDRRPAAVGTCPSITA